MHEAVHGESEGRLAHLVYHAAKQETHDIVYGSISKVNNCMK